MKDNSRSNVEADAERGRCYRRRPADDGGEYFLSPDDLDLDLEMKNVAIPFPVHVPDYRVEQKPKLEASPRLFEVEQAVSDFFRSI